MAKSLGKSIIRIYSKTICYFFQVDNPQELYNDLEADPFRDSALQFLTCKLYHKYGSLLTPMSVGMITCQHFHKFFSYTTIKDGTRQENQTINSDDLKES